MLCVGCCVECCVLVGVCWFLCVVVVYWLCVVVCCLAFSKHSTPVGLQLCSSVGSGACGSVCEVKFPF